MNATKFVNRFTKTIGCKYPIILAPMGGVSGWSLAAAVSNAGGLAFIGTGGQNANAGLHHLAVGEIVGQLLRAQDNSDRKTIGIGMNLEGFLDIDTPILDQGK